MATKLSQITSATVAPAPTDLFVGVQSGTLDRNYSTTQLMVALWGPKTLTTAAAYTVTATDHVLLVTGSLGTITMPLSSTRTWPQTTVIGAASTIFGGANTVIVRSGSDTFSGLTSLTLTNNFQSVTFYALASGGYVIA